MLIDDSVNDEGEEYSKWVPFDWTRRSVKCVLPKTQAAIDVLATLRLFSFLLVFLYVL